MSHAPEAPKAPYPGLRPFEQKESGIFFGREEHVDQLLDKLRQANFLAVVGTSGCGKSSLVRAGMIPALQMGYMTEAGALWEVAAIRPGNQPYENLVNALNKIDALTEKRRSAGDPESLLRTTLERGPLGLVEVLEETPLPSSGKMLLLVDQFEEIIQHYDKGNRDESAAFVALLLATAAAEDKSVYVVITMRSEYLGRCALFQGLPEAINNSQFLTPRLNREARCQAITRPIEVEPWRSIHIYQLSPDLNKSKAIYQAISNEPEFLIDKDQSLYSRPSWLENKSTILYYDRADSTRAKRLADSINDSTKIKFSTAYRESYLGSEEKNPPSIEIHYINYSADLVDYKIDIYYIASDIYAERIAEEIRDEIQLNGKTKQSINLVPRLANNVLFSKMRDGYPHQIRHEEKEKTAAEQLHEFLGKNEVYRNSAAAWSINAEFINKEIATFTPNTLSVIVAPSPIMASYPLLLRSEPANIPSKDQAQRVKSEFSEKFHHRYKRLVTSRGDSVVIDSASNLMWQDSGLERMTWNKAQNYIEEINSESLAGFADWRLPTIEELATLLESGAKNKRYIDPLFNGEPNHTWTADSQSNAHAWEIDFSDDKIDKDKKRGGDNNWVRAVRTPQNIDLPAAYHGRGKELEKKSERVYAVEAFDRAIALEPNYASAWYEKGKVLDEDGKTAEAQQAWEEAIRAAATQGLAFESRDRKCYLHGRALAALEKYEEAVSIYSNCEGFWAKNNTGYIYLDNIPDPQKALVAFVQAIRIIPGSAVAWRGKGLAHERLKDLAKAREAFEKASELDPDYTPVRTDLKRIEGIY